MEYYCSLCKKTITEGEFQYSMDKFGRALCREHQKLEEILHENVNLEQHLDMENNDEQPDIQLESNSLEQSKTSSFFKKVVLTTGRGIAKGTKKLAEATKKSMKRRKWKDRILRRMSGRKIKQLAREKRIKPAFIEKPTIEDYIGAIKNRVPLEEIISFAKRNHVNIRDILLEIEQFKVEEEIKKMKETGEDFDEFFMEIVEVIRSFEPFGRYQNELPYQIDLARWLQSKFPGTKIEESRGSTRPDITVKGIAIEVKGPTSHKDLVSISDKCMRYRLYFKRLVVVLFDVQVNRIRYNDWLNGLKRTYPDVIVIRK